MGRAPLDDPMALHSSTSVGPGLGALQLGADRSRSPMARDGLANSGRGSADKDPLRGGKLRAESPLPLGDAQGAHSATSVGPGLHGLRSKSPAPIDEQDDFSRGPGSKEKKKKKEKKDKRGH